MRKYIILILVIFFIGCVNRQNENSRYTEEQIASLRLDSTTILKTETDSVITINLNPFLKKQDFDFGSLVKEIKLVTLETTDESLVAPVYKVLVTDSHIYIYDKFKRGGLIIFNREGKFIRRISHGRGPGELSRLYDIAYDWENNELVAYQHSFLLFFTPSGEFIRYMRLPFGCYSLMVTPDGYLFKTLDGQGNDHLENFEDYTLLITDKKLKLKSVALPVLPHVSYGGMNYLYNNDNNNIKITHRFTDVIYQYTTKTNKLKVEYVLDYKNKKIPEHYTKGTWEEFENTVRQNDYFFYLGEYLETISHNMLFLYNWYSNITTVVYRDKKSGNMIGGSGVTIILNEMPSIGFPVATYNDYFIETHNPHPNDSLLIYSSLISDDDKRKMKNIKEDDNPVLVFFKLKDF